MVLRRSVQFHTNKLINMARTRKKCCILLLPLLIDCYCSISSGSHLDRQLLECKRELFKPIGENSSCLPEKKALDIQNSSQNSTTNHNETIRRDQFMSIDFNNIVKRTIDEEVETNCTKGGDLADVICQPKVSEVLAEQTTKKIEVTIVPLENNVATSDVRVIELGTTNIIQCRFNLVHNQSTNLDLKFKLRWLRSVASSQGYQNHSIKADSDQQVQRDQITITSEDKRSWTVQRQGGLDLFINDFKPIDEGDYFCQALSLGDKSQDEEEATVLDEKRIHLVGPSERTLALGKLDLDNLMNRDTNIYSQENLQKLLPSLQVVPEYSEVALGERIQLACVTRGLDPDPDPERIQWSYEPFERPGFKSAESSSPVNADADPLPANCSQLGNILVVWAMSYDTVGLFKCSHRLDNFNLTAEATGELMLRPSADSAPLVFVTPELLRVSADGSATIQCETTGYPPPKIEWYRVDVPDSKQFKSEASVENETQISRSKSLSIEHLEGIEVKQLNSRDAMAFCEQSGCLAINNNRLQGKSSEVLVTGLSLINIQQARSHHQGQYVCIASNKHGQNQASSLLDVEFKEAPRVRIGDEFKQQTIVLEAAGFGQPAKMQSATFKCSVESGQPAPRLKWLRTTFGGTTKIKSGKAGANYLIDKEHFSKSTNSNYGASTSDMDIFDLTRVSSATSKVSTRFENNDKTLVLHLSTISVDDEGDYVCVGENELGRHSALARLVVRRPAQVSILQTSPHIFRPNDSFQLDCLASGHPAPLDIEWSRSDRGAFFALISQQSSSGSASPISANGAGQERAVLKFDRVSGDDAGEYTCAARDPLNSSVILSDTIMLMLEEDDKTSAIDRWSAHSLSTSQRQLPKLMIRPTKVTAEVGSNITLDCLAISGLQPTVLEWLPPATMSGSLANVSIKPYYRSGAPSNTNWRTLLQLGSKLRIINVNKAHEGVYQCKGSNKIGAENAPALIKVVDQSQARTDSATKNDESNVSSRQTSDTKTKIAKLGSNIELRCQVSGMVEQPATSWSRDGRELPASSVQIEHNLWIQNLSKADEGLYLCSARSNEPNQIIQAKINLLVRGSLSWTSDEQVGLEALKHDPASINAKIVASKSNPNLGDSITLECIINFVNQTREENVGLSSSASSELEELERQVVWTNLHSGQSLFQDNVYIQNNLLIIYDLRQENAATYRCHYNDLLQHTDYNLLTTTSAVGVSSGETANFPSSSQGKEADLAKEILNIDERRVRHVRLALGARLSLECSSLNEMVDDGKYFWTRGNGASWSGGAKRRLVGRESQPLVIESLDTNDADLYQCNRVLASANSSSQIKISDYFLVQVETVAARFVQRPVSFISLPAVKDADYQLELEMKFFPEQAEGLLLFSGALSGSSVNNSVQESAPNNKRANVNSLNQPDYISLGLVRGQLEFKFELGDGTTVLRGAQQLELNQWHRVAIERNRRGATMWLDGHSPVSNSSAGKFFNLNLDSLLYIGGHQVFLTSFAANKTRKPLYNHNGTSSVPQAPLNEPKRNFYGFAQGFQGCIGSLQINGRELDLMARNRGVSMGIFECDRPECAQANCSKPQGACQVDRSLKANRVHVSSADKQETKSRQSMPEADLRCICLPPFYGPTCNQTFNSTEAKAFLGLERTNEIRNSTTVPDQGRPSSERLQLSGCAQLFGSSHKRCSSNGTSQCQALSSSSFKCHCKLGFGGELCEQQVNFTSDTSVWFNQQAYIHFAFKSAAKALESMAALGSLSTFNESEFAHLTTFTDQLNISLRVQTRSSYGLLFYTGPAPDFERFTTGAGGAYRQVSKSVLANLLARLSSGANKVADYFALSLVDGHVELSLELGSGVLVLRSNRRLNDGLSHQIEVFRSGKQVVLTVDAGHKYEAQSPGKLSALNTPVDIYLGGFPTPNPLSTNSSGPLGPASSLQLLYSFSGCLSDLRINTLGPIALTHTDHLTQLAGLRNLLPCKDGEQLPEGAAEHKHGGAASEEAGQQRVPASPQPVPKLTRKPTKPPAGAESDNDDPDELAAAAAA